MFANGRLRSCALVSMTCAALACATDRSASPAGVIGDLPLALPGPVDPASGAHKLTITDFAIPSRGVPLRLARAHNHQSERVGLFGRGWMSNLDPREGGAGLFTNDGVGLFRAESRIPIPHREPPGEERLLFRNWGNRDSSR